jgi:hypothetical protein
MTSPEPTAVCGAALDEDLEHSVVCDLPPGHDGPWHDGPCEDEDGQYNRCSWPIGGFAEDRP